MRDVTVLDSVILLYILFLLLQLTMYNFVCLGLAIAADTDGQASVEDSIDVFLRRLSIGRSYYCEEDLSYEGSVDELAIFNSKLDDVEIYDIYSESGNCAVLNRIFVDHKIVISAFFCIN